MNFATPARESEIASPSTANAFSKNRSNGLRIGDADSSFEREADRVADEVVAGATPRIGWSLSNMRIDAGAQRKCACGGSGGCTECAENSILQRSAGGAQTHEAPSIVNQVLSSPGTPLDRATRNFFEPRFGHDFSRVRVHADTRGANSAHALDAQAYTIGDHLVFGSGQYAPHSEAGRKLLAHELAHTVQQSRSGAAEGKFLRRKPNDAAPSSSEEQLSKDIHAAAIEAAREVHEKGLDKLPDHIPTAPEPRRAAPETPKPAETVADKPKEVAPATPSASPKGPQPDPGSRERQLAVGGAAQSGPAQVGGVVQGAFQDKNYVPGIAVDFLKYFHLQLGVLQPTYTLQLTHLKPTQGGAGSSASPLPPPDTAQFTATFSPAVVKVGALTIAPQVGLATAVAGDVFGTTKGPGKSGTHGQGLGVIGLQLDYSLTKRLSVTGAVGAQGGLDVDPGKGHVSGTGNVNGSVVATFHF